MRPWLPQGRDYCDQKPRTQIQGQPGHSVWYEHQAGLIQDPKMQGFKDKNDKYD